MKKRNYLYGVSILAVLAWIVCALVDIRTNECVIDYPKKCVAGQIRPMTFSEPMYVLWFQGHTQRTKDVCETSVGVTELEYERRMYGD